MKNILSYLIPATLSLLIATNVGSQDLKLKATDKLLSIKDKKINSLSNQVTSGINSYVNNLGGVSAGVIDNLNDLKYIITSGSREIIKGREIKKVSDETKKYFILTPPNHNIINPLNAISIDVPRSGWVKTKMIGIIIIVKAIEILVIEFTSSIFNL